MSVSLTFPQGKLSKLCLAMSVSALLLVGCVSEDKSSDEPNTAPARTGLQLHPASVVVADGGTIQLSTELLDDQGQVIEYTEEDNFRITWRVGNDRVVSVDETGRVTGLSSGHGPTTITAKIERLEIEEGADPVVVNTWERQISIRVEVVDVVKLFTNPRVVTLGLQDTAELVMTGLDRDRFPANLDANKVKFDADNFYVDVNRAFSAQRNAVRLSSKGERGYTFITPRYEYSGFSITGDPLLVQIQPQPQPNQPANAVGGRFVDVAMSRQGSTEYMHALHSGSSRLHYQRFSTASGSWSYPAITNNNIEYTRVYVSGQSDVGIVGLDTTNRSLSWWRSTNHGQTWGDAQVLAENVNLDSLSKLDVQVIGNVPRVLYFDDVSKELVYITLDATPSSEVIKAVTSNNHSDRIRAVALTSNRQGEARIAYATSNEVFYVAQEGDSFFQERIAANVTSPEHVTIALSRNQVPHVAFVDGGTTLRLRARIAANNWTGDNVDHLTFSEEAGISTSTWGFMPLQDIRSMQMTFDQYDAPTLTIADGGQLYYMKKLSLATDDYWRIEVIQSEGVGQSASMVIDSRNRLRVFFEDERNQWIRFWAEPIFFDYRERAARITGASDALGSNASCLAGACLVVDDNDEQP